jgi:hypothetical protein
MADVRQPIDIYDRNAVRLMQHGYHPVPIAPLGFEAKKCPVRINPNSMTYFKLSNWSTIPPVTDPQPGANIGVVMGKGVVALDYDHDDAAVIIADALPPTLVNKAGERGFTAFYRVDCEVPSEDFINADGELVLQVLSDGKQTVIPPSIHPDTCQPYRWCNGHSLYTTPPEQLALLPRNYRDIILNLGFRSGRPERPKPDKRLNSSDQGEPSGPFAELNQKAIRSLALWVPALGLYNLKRQPGRGASYRAVATWRPSREGKPDAQRDRNLSIHPEGIKDFGDNRGYSPIDLVMAVRGTDLWESSWWLDETMRPKSSIKDEDIDRLVEHAYAPSIAPEADAKAGEQEEGRPHAEAKKPESLVGDFWYPTDPAPTRPEMLIEHLIPDVCRYGILRGQMGAMKTFLLNSLAVTICSGAGSFAGQRTSRRGLVLQGEFDGSYSEARLWAAMDAAGVDRNQPIALFKKLPPPILASKRLNPAWRKWKAEFKDRVHEAEDRFGLPLTLLTMDPVNRFGGFDDENSAPEGNIFGKEMDALCEEFGCTALVSDHLGKVAEKGTRGTSTKEQNAFYVLDAGETAKAIDETRVLKIVRIKEDASGVGVNFHMESVEVEYDYKAADGSVARTKRTTLVPVWDSEIKPLHQLVATGGQGNELSPDEQLALTKLVEIINKKGVELPSQWEVPAGLRGVQVEEWFMWLSRAKLIHAKRGNTRMLFGKIVTRLQNKKAIGVLDGWVWIPLEV